MSNFFYPELRLEICFFTPVRQTRPLRTVVMVKVQRKPSGSTNAFNNVARPNTTSGTGHHNSFSRPLKLKVRTNIFSDTGPDPNNTQVVHKPVVRKESATWMIKKNNQMKYTTENVEKYEDPRKKSMQVCVKNEGYETARNKMRSQAADKFFKLAKSRYGGAEDLFRAVSMERVFCIVMM